MTTNVYDVQAQQVATDSRWSISLKDGLSVIAIVYTDNAAFDKIEVNSEYCAMFAGNSSLIAEWKTWIASPNKVVLKRPQVVNDFAMCLVENKTGAIKFEHGQKISDSQYRFAGTGAFPAYTCWSRTRCAITAVGSAKKDDHYSGGDVKYVDLKNNKNNLSQCGGFDSIKQSILTGGMVMYMSENFKSVPIQEAAKTDKRIEKLMTQIASGEVSAEAPSGRDTIVWTDGDEKRLDAALEECFGFFAK